MNFKKITLLILPLGLLCSCGGKSDVKPNLIKRVVKAGDDKATAALYQYTDYLYTDGVLSAVKLYEYDDSGNPQILTETIYEKNTNLELDYVIKDYSDGKFESMDHEVYKFNEKGTLIYELLESRKSEQGDYHKLNEIEYLITYNSKGKEETVITHDILDDNWHKEEYMFDNLDRISEMHEYSARGSTPVYDHPNNKYAYTYVGNTEYVDEERVLSYNEGRYVNKSRSKYTYNDSMLLTKFEKYDQYDNFEELIEITYEGKVVTTKEYEYSLSGQEWVIEDTIIEEYASDYVKDMINPVVVARVKYNDGSIEFASQDVYKYTYTDFNDYAFVEYQSYSYIDDNWKLDLYESVEYTYDNK